MHRYRLIEVGCSRELYAIPDDEEPVRDGRTVARFTVGEASHGDAPQSCPCSRNLPQSEQLSSRSSASRMYCSHLHEPDCAVRAAVESGAIAVSRYASYVSIVTEDLQGAG